MLILNPKKSWFLMKSQCKNCLSFCIFLLFLLVRFRKVPNAKYCIKTNDFSMFLGFAQFGKQSKNSKNNCKKQARKSNEKDMNKSLKNHEKIIPKTMKKPSKKQYVFRGPQKSSFFPFGGVLEPTWTQKYEFELILWFFRGLENPPFGLKSQPPEQ